MIATADTLVILDKVASQWCRTSQISLLLSQSALWERRKYAASQEFLLGTFALSFIYEAIRISVFLSVAVSFGCARCFI